MFFVSVLFILVLDFFVQKDLEISSLSWNLESIWNKSGKQEG